MENLRFSFLFILFSFLSCKMPDHFYSITITNNSNDSICTFFADRYSKTQYPDTTLPIDRPALFVMKPLGGKYYHDSRVPWSREFEYLAADTLSIYIFAAKIYKESSWPNIKDNYQILKRYDLSLSDLNKLNRKISFPPTSEMRSIKQFPPF